MAVVVAIKHLEAAEVLVLWLLMCREPLRCRFTALADSQDIMMVRMATPEMENTARMAMMVPLVVGQQQLLVEAQHF
jgi:hypothetical protein